MRQMILAALLMALCTVPAAFAEEYPEAYVSHFAPERVAAGALFSVVGAGFGDEAGTVRIGEVECEVTAWSDNRIRVRAPMEALVDPVTVVVGGATMTSHNVICVTRGDVPDLPSIAAMEGVGDDGSVAPGDVLTLSGKNFGATEEEVTFAVDPSLRYPIATKYATVPTGVIESWSDTEIKVTVPDSCVGESYVLVTLPGFVLLAPSRVTCPSSTED